MDNGLAGLIGLSRKAGKLELGEEPVSAAAASHRARLILLASDAAENTAQKAHRLGQAGNCPVLSVPLTKAELGLSAGRASCALLAFTDLGLAAAAVKKLSPSDPEGVALSEELDRKARKADRRRREQRKKEKARQGRPQPNARAAKETKT